MSKDRDHSQTSSPRYKEQSRELSVSEVSRFLKRLAKFYHDPRTGNPALSEALAEFASALGRGRKGGMKFSEAVAELSAPPKRSPSLDLSRLKGLELEEVKKILYPDIKKSDLIELGVERFAISRSRMMHLTTEQVLDTIKSAVRNEESLSSISREAQRSGSQRPS